MRKISFFFISNYRFAHFSYWHTQQQNLPKSKQLQNFWCWFITEMQTTLDSFKCIKIVLSGADETSHRILRCEINWAMHQIILNATHLHLFIVCFGHCFRCSNLTLDKIAVFIAHHVFLSDWIQHYWPYFLNTFNHGPFVRLHFSFICSHIFFFRP